MPKRLTNRYKQLRKRRKRLDRLINKALRQSKAQIPHSRWVTLRDTSNRQWEQLWSEITASLQHPDKPDGLESFLEEMGMTDR
jgi:trehalose/maltose hydrolase-like predicted phosphorylase